MIVPTHAAHRRFAAIGYLLVILWVNAYVCRDLFFTEYTGHTNSIQGLWIAMARLAGEHWVLPSWWPYHDGGIPFEYTYMPLVPGLTALYARLAGCSAARAFNATTGIVYCLGPVAMFVMARRMTRAPGYSFWAALAYSLTSPARALIRDPHFDPAFLWTSRRLYTMAVWDDVPHGMASCLVPFAILFLARSLTGRRLRDSVLAGVFIALSVSASVFAAVAIPLSALCLLFVLPKEQLRSNALLTGAIGGAAYLAICPYLPPSLIATIRANQQMFPEDQWSLGSLTALSMVALGWVLVWQASMRCSRDWPLRFFLLFAYLMSAIPLLDAYRNRHFLPQAGRYQPEMEVGIALAAVFLIRPVSQRLPWSIKAALAFVLLCTAAEQMVSHRRYAKEILKPVDITRSIEYRVAKWVDANIPGQRVMVPGSIAQWLNVFSDAPQLSGGSYSTTPNWTQQDAMTSVLAAKGPSGAAESLLWLKAFGVQALTVCGPKSMEFWKPYADPLKFEGLLPVLWREEDTTIYRVPQRTTSLAHVIPLAAAVPREEGRRVSAPELEKYVAALEDPSLPTADAPWDGFRRMRIHTAAQPDQVVSVQTSFHPGWRARANGRAAQVVHDGLGFLLIQPRCSGACEIELTYNGGWENWLCRWFSALTVLGVLAYPLVRRKVKNRSPQRRA